MRYVLTGLLMLLATVLFATGCERVARAPDQRTPGDNDPSPYREDVAEVVVPGERPGCLMPEVVACVSEMPEVVIRASWSAAPLVASAMQAAAVAN